MITTEEFNKYIHDVLLIRFEKEYTEVENYNGIISVGGTIKDDNCTLMALCVYDWHSKCYYTRKLNVDWVPDNKIEWFIRVSLAQMIDLINHSKENTMNTIKSAHYDFLKSFGGHKIG